MGEYPWGPEIGASLALQARDVAQVLEQIELDHTILQRPLNTTLSNTPLRMTLLEWLKEKVAGIDQAVHHNKRVLEHFIHDLVPVCDEVRELKLALEKETTRIFQHIEN